MSDMMYFISTLRNELLPRSFLAMCTITHVCYREGKTAWEPTDLIRYIAR